MKQAKIEKKQLSELILWDKNPRAIHEVDYKRLKNLIKELGLFKPFLVNQDNIILGGNMRYRVCKDLGYKEVYVSTVETKDETEMFSYALADNDRAGHYVEEKLKQLVIDSPKLDLNKFSIDLTTPYSLKEIMNFELHDSQDKASEGEFDNYLKENQDKALLKILTTKDIERQIRTKIDENKSSDDEDDGEILLSLIS